MKSHYIEIREAAKNSRNEKFKEKFVLSSSFSFDPANFLPPLKRGLVHRGENSHEKKNLLKVTKRRRLGEQVESLTRLFFLIIFCCPSSTPTLRVMILNEVMSLRGAMTMTRMR